MKRKQQNVSWAYILLLITVIVYSCSKDFQTPDPDISEVQFGLVLPSSSGGRSANNVEDVEYVLFSVESEDGTKPYQYEQLSLIKVNDSYISEPFSLPVGDYLLTDFILLDKEGDALFVTPQQGSEYSSLVDSPLPNDFEVAKDEITKLVPQVVSTEESNPEDFGYAAFGFEVVDFFKIQLTVMGLDEETENYELVEAELNIKADGELILEKSLDAATNEIQVKGDDYHEYTLSITKEGYQDFSYTYSADSLKEYEGADPLIVVLDNSDLDYEGLLYGIVEGSTGMLSFASVSYNGNFEIIGQLSGVSKMTNWSSSFDHESGYYHFRHTLNKKTHVMMIDKFGQEVISSEIILLNSVYSSDDELLYGIKYSSSEWVIHSLDLDLNEIAIAEIGPYNGFGTWGAYDKEGYYLNRTLGSNLIPYLVCYDFDSDSLSSTNISNNHIAPSQLALVDEDDLLYGFAQNTSGGYDFFSMNYNGVETFINSFNVGTPIDLNHITYDEKNELLITSYGNKLYFFDKSGVLVKDLSLEGLDFNVPSLRAGQ